MDEYRYFPAGGCGFGIMSNKTTIEWTDSTWNPVTGCTKVSPGCDNCYAERLIDTRMIRNPRSQRYGMPFATVMLHADRLAQPLRWKRPRRIFVNSLSDLFHRDVPDEFIRNVFGIMTRAQQHVFQVLTKRPERMRRLVPAMLAGNAPAQNIWLGVSVENNDYAWRADMLRETPAAIRFLSVEPMLGPIEDVRLDGIDWVIVGGESGPGARPLDPQWVRATRDRCGAGSVAFFFKQWGGSNKHATGRILDGCIYDALPSESWPRLEHTYQK